MHRSIFAGLTTIVAAGAIAGPVAAAHAATTASGTPTPTPTSTAVPNAGTISIGDCQVKHSRNAGGFTWAYCPVSAIGKGPNGSGKTTVDYKVNLKTYVPVKNSSYSPQTGTMTGPGLQNLKFAFPKLSVAQVERKLTVTLSNATGATITKAVANAA
jgi:hypothetical protein